MEGTTSQMPLNCPSLPGMMKNFKQVSVIATEKVQREELGCQVSWAIVKNKAVVRNAEPFRGCEHGITMI